MHGNGWDALHVGGRTTYLEFLNGNRFQWTTSLSAGENSAASYYPNAEGIIYHNSTLYFVAKVTRTLFILDLDDMTYTSERTGSSWVGQGAFNSQPDQIIENDLDKRKFIYFTEDGGRAPGVMFAIEKELFIIDWEMLPRLYCLCIANHSKLSRFKLTSPSTLSFT